MLPMGHTVLRPKWNPRMPQEADTVLGSLDIKCPFLITVRAAFGFQLFG